MRIKSSGSRVAAQTLLLGLIPLLAGTVAAQNFVKNPDFEEPFGTNNWTVVYTSVPASDGGVNAPTNCGPNDFMIAGRSSMAHKDKAPGTWDGDPYYWDKHGACFAPNHDWMMHAYFKQTVTGLTPGAAYTVSAWMAQFESNDNYLTKCAVYLEAVGGPNGLVSKVTPRVATNCYNNAGAWTYYAVTNTATPGGQIEVRLHFSKFATVSSWEWRNFNAFYDHVSLIRTGTSPTQPAYRILSLTRTNQNFALTWESVINNKYRIQYSPSLESPMTWSWVTWSPYVDPKLYATGSSFTFRTNLASLFSYDPTFDPNVPRYFRIWSESYTP